MRRRLAAVVVVLCGAAGACAAEPFRYPEGTHGKGELKYRNGVPVLVAVGTPEEMGEQIGALGVKPLAPKMGMVKKYVETFGPAWPILVKVCEGLVRQFPEEYRTELDAMARAGGVERELLVVANTIGDVQHLGRCSALIVEPSRSATGQAIFGRNADYPPVGDLGQASLVIVRRPAGKRAFVSVAFPGVLLCGSEMNDAGLALGGNDVRQTRDGSPKLNPKGTSMVAAGRRILETCGSLQEAEKALRELKATTTGNAVLCDSKAGAVFEVTPKTVQVRRAEEGLCICTNHFCTPELAVPVECWRYQKLQAYRARPKLTIEDVARALHEVNQGPATIHSMIFEPAALRMHLAMGTGPVTKGPRVTLDLAPLFKEKVQPTGAGGTGNKDGQ
jgi:hypothetical protein